MKVGVVKCGSAARAKQRLTAGPWKARGENKQADGKDARKGSCRGRPEVRQRMAGGATGELGSDSREGREYVKMVDGVR